MRTPSHPRSPARPRRPLLRVILPLALFLFGCFTPEPPPGQIPSVDADAANVAILGDVGRLAPGSQASFLVQVRAPYTQGRWPDAPVEVYLNDPDGSSEQVFSGVTGADGVAQVSFPVPADLPNPNQVMEIVTTIQPESADEYSPYAGTFRTYQDVYVGRTYNVLLTTDKPVYQPGQVIHLRGLALDTLDLHAAAQQAITLTVADPQGNKLMQQAVTASDYGIAGADFPLDAQAPSGDYTVSAALGPNESARTVEVKPYSLPRFQVTFHPDQTFYLPGATATGAVEARYFFGKPLVGGAVTMRGTLKLGEDAQAVVELKGETDSEGRYVYSFAVPDDFGGKLDNHSADIDLEITVTDTAGHSESIDDSVTVAEKPLLIEAVPEAGQLRRGIDDRVTIDVTYPDGVAAQAALTVTDEYSQTFTAVTDAYGLAVITLTTPNTGLTPLRVTADDGRGHVVQQPLVLASDFGAGTASVLLRPDRAEYHVGDTLNVDILTASSAGFVDTVYLDIIKDRQSFGLVALPVTDGVAQAAIPLDGGLLGTLELNAYTVDAEGRIARDRRYVLVNPGAAEVSAAADKDVYRPGDTATLDIQVGGDVVFPAAVGVSIVDESVYAIEDEDPGFARTYFLLNRELQKKQYGLHEFVDLAGDDPSPYDAAPDSVRYAETEAARQLALQGALAQVLADESAAASSRHADSDDLQSRHADSDDLQSRHADSDDLQSRHADSDDLQSRHADSDDLQSRHADSDDLRSRHWGNRIYLAAPLLGLALYDGSRKRRRLLIALVVFGLGAFVWGACASPAAPAAPAAATAGEAPDAAAVAGAVEGTTTAAQGQKPPRLRQFFPETLFWLPELLTDETGHAQVDFPLADTITTWRASLLVSDRAGHIGSSDIPLRVFQDFFVEPDLPRFLTVGDEIDAPVAVYNYLAQTQTITLSVTPAPWFELRGDPQLTLTAGPNEVLAAYVPLRVTGFGVNRLQITANGSQMSDAVEREVEVLPDGQRTTDVVGGQLVGAGAERAGEGRLDANRTLTLPVPASAVPGASRVTVKLYGGAVSQALAGLEGLLQMPYGCFEQTSSATYPNVLVLDYLQRSGGGNPSIKLQAQTLIRLGYQKLLTFEVPGSPGGFSLFGEPPAETMLTAYGLLEFGDMRNVAYVDPDLLARVVTFLEGRQNIDGSWIAEGYYTGDGSVALDGSLAATAYIAWGLADAGYADGSAVRAAVDYLQANVRGLGAPTGAQTGNQTPDQSGRPGGDKPRAGTGAPPPSGEPGDFQPASPLPLPPYATPTPPPPPAPQQISSYTLALIANALVAAGEDATPVLDELVARAQRGGEGQGWAYWPAGTETYLGSYGDPAAIETTALVAQALQRSGAYPDTARGALDYLIAHRDSRGSFYTTQATVQALKALLLATDNEEGKTATVTIRHLQDGEVVGEQAVTIDDDSADLVQAVTFADAGPGSQITLEAAGDRLVQYQVVTDFYLPWDTALARPGGDGQAEGGQSMRIHVTYDRTELVVGEVLNAAAEVELLADNAGTLLVELGLPPGFAPLTDDLDALVRARQIQRYEVSPHRIVLYLTHVRAGEPLRFAYRLQARYPLTAQTAASQVYDYYTPDRWAVEPPQRITVVLGTP